MTGAAPLLRTSGSARTAFGALAFLALLVVLTRPICDLAHSPGAALHDSGLGAESHFGAQVPSHDDSEPCCASVGEESLAFGSIAFVPDVRSPSAVLAQYVPTGDVNRVSFRSPRPPDRPPVTRPYYARSARILI